MKNLFRNKTGSWGKTFKLRTLAGALLCAVAGLSASPALAAPVVLTDLNSVAIIDPADATSPSNFQSWTVDGIAQLFEESFWYRIGSTGGEANINTLPFVITPLLGNILIVTYTGPGFTVTINYTLSGGGAGSGTSDMGEVLSIHNTSTTSALDIHFFEYTDFDLNGSSSGDNVQLINPNKWSQSGDSVVLSETSGLPDATGCQDGLFPNTLNALSDGNPTTFAPNLPANCGLVSGDVTWAWEWDRNLGAGGSLLISKDKHLDRAIPEPGSLMLLGLGLGCLAAWGRRQVRKDA